MKSIKKKDIVQKKALNAWLDNGKKGTCEVVTGLGKTFIALHALYTMPKNKKINLFLAEVSNRKKDLLEQIEIYNKIFNRNVLKDYTLKFKCYQGAYKYKDLDLGLVIADKILFA
ncbi:MAG: DEAD/DEAH box helicase family protein [Senegalia sp. (in: firmicutes)]